MWHTTCMIVWYCMYIIYILYILQFIYIYISNYQNIFQIYNMDIIFIDIYIYIYNFKNVIYIYILCIYIYNVIYVKYFKLICLIYLYIRQTVAILSIFSVSSRSGLQPCQEAQCTRGGGGGAGVIWFAIVGHVRLYLIYLVHWGDWLVHIGCT